MPDNVEAIIELANVMHRVNENIVELNRQVHTSNEILKDIKDETSRIRDHLCSGEKKVPEKDGKPQVDVYHKVGFIIALLAAMTFGLVLLGGKYIKVSDGLTVKITQDEK